MMTKQRPPSMYQRNAFAPGLLAAAVLFVAPVLMGGDWFAVVLFVAAILAVIVAWFAIEARQWWWLPVFAVIAVAWNPVFPFPFSGSVWTAAQSVAAVIFLVAGTLIKVPRA
ncbi:MAG: hypothetical protein CMH38_00865 [Microbacterium sp.]|uniref:DUF6804 family protein n=1 Tax=Microbacterium TaxID=33882 RepID=UPI0008D986E8|nr:MULTISPECIES: DUF6804 family protein [Microbacterium]MAY48472.1 hypothetical protein [Microbacterium sp.]MDZ8276341.1 DUF6804 family protein [Microbacterium aquimaris]HAM12256.1 hypothetical protein [Microbacterium sp.]